jgi:hypothetical protein
MFFTITEIELRLPKNISSSYNIYIYVSYIEMEYQIIRTTEILQQFEVELRIKLFNINYNE